MSEIKWTAEQLKAIKHEGNILISASAGSGKTTVLVERVLNNIINRHIPINRMLVLTFTDMASQEMKDKILDKLIEVAKEGGENAKLMKEQIALIPFCQISTIHSFCMEIIRSHFDYLGINPTFDILNDMDKELYMLKAFNNVIDKCTADKQSNIDIDLLVGVLTKNRKLDELFEVVKVIQKNIETQVDRDNLPNQIVEMYTPNGLKKVEKIIVNEFTIEFNDCYCELVKLRKDAIENAKYVDGLIDRIEVFRKNSSLEEMVSYAYVDNFSINAVVKKSTEKEGYVDSIKAVKGQIDELIKRLVEFSPYSEVKERYFGTKNVLVNLVEFTKKYIDEYDRLKAKENQFDFSDLEKYAIEVLKKDELANEISEKYDAVFVDEYQDTNYIQKFIVEKVAKKECFYVGDLKQSIYGFRLCEPKIIKDKYDTYKAIGEGEVIDLNCNFRSSSNVINFVNQIFEIIMTEKSSMVDYKNTSRLVKGGTIEEKIEKNNDCKIILFDKIEAEKKEFTGIYDVLNEEIEEKTTSEDYETQYIIDEINKLVGVYDIDGRKCRYSDIAILVQSKPKFVKMAKRMGKFIPLNLVDFNQNLSVQDIDTINNILSLSINIYQDKPLAKGLLSFFGGLTEQELADIRIKYPKGTFYNSVLSYANHEKDDISTKLYKFISLLDKVRFTSSFKDTPTLFRNLLNTGFDEYIISLKDGQERLKNLNNYIIDISTNNKLYNIIDYLEYTKTNNIETKTSISKNRDAVKVMTIHKSKGLEFPIVFIPNLDAQFNKDELKQPFLYNSHIGAGIYYYDTKNYVKKDSLGRILVKNYIDRERNMEQIRLFYVALTRAKKKLYLLGVDKVAASTKVSDCSSYLGMLKYAISQDSSLNEFVEHQECMYLPTADYKKFSIGFPDKEYVKIIKDTINFIYPHKEATNMLVNYSATSINKETSMDNYKIQEENKASKIGIIYHKVMQFIDFNCYTVEEVKQEIDRMVEANILSSEDAKLVNPNQIFKVLQLDIINIASMNKCFREKEFLIKADSKEMGFSKNSEDIIIQGVMDLLIIGDTTYLVDYKYSGKSDIELVNMYEKQFYVYEMAYKTLFGAEIDKKVLVNLKKGTEIYIK